MLLDNGVEIEAGKRPYIVAELNSSHNGKVETAKKMIDAVLECGCDCVKFQSWSAESLYCDEYYADNPISKRIVKGFSLEESKLEELFDYCRKKRIDCTSTPYSESEVDFLVRMNVPFIKIASMEINNFPFLEYVAKTGKPIVLSTGMSTYDEIDKAVSMIRDSGNDRLCILHCVSVYPADVSVINLNNMVVLKERYSDCTVGYSDHTIGNEVATAAVALGAGLIEKHFTLDNSKMGMDNNMATEPVEMRKLVEKCHNVFLAMGSRERVLTDKEVEQRQKMRRSIVATEDIVVGNVIGREMLEFKRPGIGMAPEQVDAIVGCIANNDIKKGYLIRESDIGKGGNT